MSWLAALVAGAMLSGQARINSDLAHTLAPVDPGRAAVSAAAVSFSVGTLALILAVAVTASWRPALRALRAAPPSWWWCVGGLGGAFLVSTSAYAASLVGLALLAVAVVAGQAAGSLVVDEIGLGPGGRQSISPRRVIGAGLAVAGLLLAASSRGTGVGGHLGSLVLLALAGVAVAGQQAANGRLALATGQPLVAALVSFLGGTVVLVGLAVGLGGGHTFPGVALWWQWSGGLGGAAYIALAASVVRRIGVLGVSLASTTGQLLGGVVLDAARLGRLPVAATWAGIVVTMLGVLFAATASRPGMSGPTA